MTYDVIIEQISDILTMTAIGQKILTGNDYTVGWICALPCELTAAKVMLDEIHPITAHIRIPAEDRNVYCLGSIAGHNTVIASLPVGSYGTSSLTGVAVQLVRTFKSITIPLLVGIAGGVLSPRDIRLGDVVVGIPAPGRPAVVQYDYGKMLADGQIKRTGNLSNPTTQLLSAVSHVQADNDIGSTTFAKIIDDALRKGRLVEQGYGSPELDILHSFDCMHSTENFECTQCVPKVIERQTRSSNQPIIHYGCIASGNLVIKNSKFRDTVSKSLDAICFEMEAAGLPDYYPALVIRGICDYCDSTKNKDYQKYASISAAAYAKELLTTIPIARPVESAVYAIMLSQPMVQEVIENLNFEDSKSRIADVGDRHPQTLAWFKAHPKYLKWLDAENTTQHHGVLWIKGKPGAGKSTLMKFALGNANVSEDNIVSFFFSARGTILQKTTVGMYRALLYQLLTKFPFLRNSVDLLGAQHRFDSLDVLRSLFRRVLYNITEPIQCFIDALDESPENEIRSLIEDLEMIGEKVGVLGLFRVCLSSRYYPHVSIKTGLHLHIDEEEGHVTDIRRYIDAELRIGTNDEAKKIKSDMVQKSAGIFLWVALVTRLLKIEYDRGRLHAMRKKLEEIPTELNKLFQDMLLRDNENLRELTDCIRLVLYSAVPLKTSQFYAALLSADEDHEITQKDSCVAVEDMLRYIVSSSKGLLEQSPEEGRIQVIHESVRQYLLHGSLTDIWPGFSCTNSYDSHLRLATICRRYIISTPLELGPITWGFRFPFRTYACNQILFHAEAVFRDNASAIDFDQWFPYEAWKRLVFGTRRDYGGGLLGVSTEDWTGVSLSQVLMVNNMPCLLRSFLSHGNNTIPLWVVLDNLSLVVKEGYNAIIRTLLDFAPGIDGEPQLMQAKIQSCLYTAASCKCYDALQLMLELGAKPQRYASISEETVMMLAVRTGDRALLRKVLPYAMPPYYTQEQSRDVSGLSRHLPAQDKQSMTYLHWAVAYGQESIVDILLSEGADTEMQGSHQQTALHMAASRGFLRIVESLIKHNANLEARDDSGCTALDLAILSSHHRIIRLLLEYGVKGNTTTSGSTALKAAANLARLTP